MSLIVPAKAARDLGFRGVAKYEDGTRPRAEAPTPAPAPAPEPAAALLPLVQAINAQTGNLAAQRDALIGVLNSNADLARAVLAAVSANHRQPEATTLVAEEWSFEHVYEYGNLVKTIARRVR